MEYHLAVLQRVVIYFKPAFGSEVWRLNGFVVGDLVEYIGELNGVYGPRAGNIGTVVRIRNPELQQPTFSIQFDCPIRGGHSAGGHGLPGHCWNCGAHRLRRVEEDKISELSDTEINALIER